MGCDARQRNYSVEDETIEVNKIEFVSFIYRLTLLVGRLTLLVGLDVGISVSVAVGSSVGSGTGVSGTGVFETNNSRTSVKKAKSERIEVKNE